MRSSIRDALLLSGTLAFAACAQPAAPPTTPMPPEPGMPEAAEATTPQASTEAPAATPAAPASADAVQLTAVAEVRAPTPADLGPAAEQPIVAVITTSAGALRCTLDAKRAPMTVANFVGLATGTKAWKDPATGEVKQGVHFYDGLIFHRVIPGFMIQGGDPLGQGTGGPGYKFADEIDRSVTFDGPAILAMANSGPATNGSQFFITDKATPWLDGRHTIFGRCDNADVVSKIAGVPRDDGDRPLTPVKIESIRFER